MFAHLSPRLCKRAMAIVLAVAMLTPASVAAIVAEPEHQPITELVAAPGIIHDEEMRSTEILLSAIEDFAEEAEPQLLTDLDSATDFAPEDGYYDHFVEDFESTAWDKNRWKGTTSASLTTNPGSATLTNGNHAGLSQASNWQAAGQVLGVEYKDSVIVEFRANVTSYSGIAAAGTVNFGFQMGLIPTVKDKTGSKRLMVSIDPTQIETSNESGTWNNKIGHTTTVNEWRTYRFEITNIKTANNPPVKMWIDGVPVGGATVFCQYEGSVSPALNFWVARASTVQIDDLSIKYPIPGVAETPAWEDGSALTLTETAGTARLSWPQAQGTVTEYRLYKNNDLLATVEGTSYTAESAATTQERYTVQAVNSGATVQESTGGPSVMREPTIIVPPAAPNNLKISGVTTTSATAQWDAPTSGGTVTGYKVYLNEALQATTVERSYTLSGLTPSTDYTVKVLATGAEEMTSAAALASFQTPADMAWYDYISEDFDVGGDGEALASGLTWAGPNVTKDGVLSLKNNKDKASVQNFSKPYPDQFVVAFRARTSARPAEKDWCIQMQITDNMRLMLAQSAGKMISCTANGAWANTINGTPNDTEWHTYRLEFDKTAKTAKLYIDNTYITTISLQVGGNVNPAFNFFKENSNATTSYLDNVRLQFPVDAAGAPIWTPAQSIRQTESNDSSATITWDRAIGAVTGYEIYQNSTLADTVAADVTTYTFENLSAAASYTVRVEARNENGVTTDGPSVSIRTKYDPDSNGIDVAPFWTRATGGYGAYRIPGIVVTKQDTIIAYCEARRSGGDWDPMDLIIRRSTDSGETWSENLVLIPGLAKNITVNNPVIIVDQDGVTLHMVYCVMYGVEKLGGGVFYMKSVDDGVTWSEPQNISAMCHPSGTDPTFKSRNVIATGPGHGIQLKDGTLLIPIWMTDGPGTTSKGHQPSVVSTLYSKDGGTTWQMGEIIHRNEGGVAMSNPNETTAVELSDGRVMLNIRRQYSASAANPNYRMVSISPNGYSDWSTPYADTQLMDAGNGCFGSLIRYDARTILFSNAEHPTERRNVTVKASFDDGKTWVAKKSVEPGMVSNTYSDMAVDSKGTIYTLFETENAASMKLARFNLNYLTKPFAPVGIAVAEVAYNAANVTWSRGADNLGEASYNVYLNGSTSPVNSASITGTSYTLTGLTAETAYTVRVVELGPVEGNPSDSVAVSFETGSATSVPVWFAGSKVTSGERTANSLTLSWPTAFGATEYTVYVDDVKTAAVSAPTTMYRVEKLVSGTTYQLRVEASNEYGNAVNVLGAQASMGYLQPAPVNAYLASETAASPVKINFLGDSITYGQDPANNTRVVKQYHTYLADSLKLDNANYGIRGSVIAVLDRGDRPEGRNKSFAERYVDMRADADIVFVFGGTNDYGIAENVPFGTWADTENTTFLGGLRVLIEGVITKYPGKQIVFMTPLQRGDKVAANSIGKTLPDYVNAIRDMCNEYGIPLLDAYAAPEMDLRSNYPLLMADKLHPSAKGQEVMANWIYQALQDEGVLQVVTPVESVAISDTEKTLMAGERFTLTATVLPENATNKDVRWSSSAEEIATVTDGVVTAISPGTAVITVTTADKDLSKSCTVTVTAAPPTDSDTTISYTVKATAGPGGSITPASTRVSRGGNKTFTMRAEEGYTLSALLLNGSEVSFVTAGGSWSYTLTNVRAGHTLEAVFALEREIIDPDIPLGNFPFLDVSGHWAASAIAFAVQAGLMKGTGGTSFHPEGAATRATVTTILHRMAGLPKNEKSAPFHDVVEKSWYAEAVAWGVEQNVVTGISDTAFDPDKEITRQELAVLLYRYAKFVGVETTVSGNSVAQFSDGSDVAPWSTEAMAWCVETGILTGTGGGLLAPKGTATRAELATLLERLETLLKK